MKIQQNLEYAYIGMRSTYMEESGREVVYVFAALRRVKQHISGPQFREQMNSLAAESVTIETSKAPKAFLELPHERTYIISRAESKRLQAILETDKERFLLYEPSGDNI